MLLGVISDIHADHKALTIALDLLVGHGVDKIVWLGDVVEKGTNGDACADLLQNWLIPCVRGNHDEMAIENQMFVDDDPRWHTLRPETLDYLTNLPMTHYSVREGIRILMCHGSPEDTWEYMHPDMAPAKRFKEITTESNADLVLCGHTHNPMDVEYKGVRFLNPGSICGIHSRGSRTYGLLLLPEMRFQICDLP